MSWGGWLAVLFHLQRWQDEAVVVRQFANSPFVSQSLFIQLELLNTLAWRETSRVESSGEINDLSFARSTGKGCKFRPNGRRGTSVITKILAACLLAKPKSCSCYKICFRSRKRREKENERGTSSRSISRMTWIPCLLLIAKIHFATPLNSTLLFSSLHSAVTVDLSLVQIRSDFHLINYNIALHERQASEAGIRSRICGFEAD